MNINIRYPHKHACPRCMKLWDCDWHCCRLVVPFMCSGCWRRRMDEKEAHN